ncbi:MAG: Npt1/Npt2 family nucleotide transporter [Pseudomonadota bacterium]|nr:Npt1/Npt2 family nucleotide transporter [Pseudomonadota bacterium]
MDNKEQKMSGLRLALFPVADHELAKFLPMCGMIFCTIFAYSLLRAFKDSLVLSAPGSGAEVLPFLKMYVVFPVTLLATIGYMNLRKSFDVSKAYYIIVSVFIFIFTFFALVLYPFQAYVQPSAEWLSSMQAAYPPFAYVFSVLGNWTYALFYVASELWGTFALSVLFWQFANETTTPSQSKRFYPLYVMAGNISLLFLTPVLWHISRNSNSDVYEVCALSVVFGLLLMFFFSYALQAQKKEEKVEKIVKKKKKKLSMSESFAVLFRSEYVGYIAVLVLSYGIVINVVEVVWKSQLKVLYPTRQAMLEFNGYYNLLLGFGTIGLNYLGKGVIRQLGWFFGAIITPVVTGVLGCFFFIYVLGQSSFTAITMSLQMAPITLAVWFGAYSVILSKGSKYSFFDPTKEMAFIPLDPDLKINGKAAVDGVGGRLGKSAGGLLTSSLLILYSTSEVAATVLDIAPFLFVVVVVLTCAWVFSVARLSILYNKAVSDTEREELALKNAEAKA